MTIITARVRSTTGRYCFYRCLSVNIKGGSQVQVQVGGVQVGEGGSQVKVQVGEGSSLRSGGVPGPGPGRGGIPVSDLGGEGYPVSVKGKFFDIRFGLIHVQTGKKIFCRGTPPPPSKGKIF